MRLLSFYLISFWEARSEKRFPIECWSWLCDTGAQCLLEMLLVVSLFWVGTWAEYEWSLPMLLYAAIGSLVVAEYDSCTPL